uniref:Uncharacterized protein n=1 Tax=Anguilla anguilla TaxID=7936 RepID=A0A0E9TCU1_ANGAN
MLITEKLGFQVVVFSAICIVYSFFPLPLQALGNFPSHLNRSHI